MSALVRTMPAQRPGASRQDWATPPELLDAVKRRLDVDEFVADLAASSHNAVADVFFTEATNSLARDWSALACAPVWAWLNPPYGHIAPWVAKAQQAGRDGASIAVLVPAAVGANWCRDFVDGHAHALFLNGRVTFVGAEGPYPKDCAVLLYGPLITPGYSVWSWRETASGSRDGVDSGTQRRASKGRAA